MLDALGDGQALFFRPLADRVGSTDDAALAGAVWDLVWAGHLTNDTLAPLRALLGGGRRAPVPAGRAAHPLPAARAGSALPSPRPARRPWPAAGHGCPSGTSTRPGGPPRSPTCCWSGTAWSPAAR